MTRYPSATISFRVYEDSVNEVGLAKATLPDIAYKAVTTTGSGMMGDIEVPLIGMLENMELGLDFLGHTDPGTFPMLMEPRKHLIELRVAEEYWDVEDAEVGLWGIKHVLVARPKLLKPGGLIPATAADSSGTFTVYAYKAYRDGKELWDLDKRNMRCVINGKDWMADVRKALGYN